MEEIRVNVKVEATLPYGRQWRLFAIFLGMCACSGIVIWAGDSPSLKIMAISVFCLLSIELTVLLMYYLWIVKEIATARIHMMENCPREKCPLDKCPLEKCSLKKKGGS